MTNKYNNWERIERLLEYTKMTANAFALHIGISRAENIYHIKRGNFGISEDLADRIVSRFPEVNRTWLLTGVGNMLNSITNEQQIVPFFEQGIEQMLSCENKRIKLGNYRLPFSCDCDIAIRTQDRSMVFPGTAATDLLLKRTTINEMVQGNEYLVILNDNSYMWRKIRCVKGHSEQWRMVAYDRVESPDIIINKCDIKYAWRVIARMAILVS